ncbi:hypothetical protein H0O03_01615 [Candidatus Micrarchaeota archaeon]|nr:hypothetical protein [Candidatus Micrarchaeota archaeon]
MLLSGGLDSLVAAKLLLDQGIELEGLNFTSPFCTCGGAAGGCAAATRSAKQLGIPLKIVAKGMDYLQIVEHPKHERGRALNPCIDCRIYALKKAKEYCKEVDADFIATGEVAGQRPMSQTRYKLQLIEKEAGLDGLVVRPLSAKLLPPTIPEQKGLVDREKLLAVGGRGRKTQMELAKKNNYGYDCPAGGCLLTEREYSRKLVDLFEHKPYSLRDVLLLRIGRHYRLNEKAKVVLGRNEAENALLQKMTGDNALLEPDFPAPTALVTRKASRALGEAAWLVLKHAKKKGRLLCEGKEIIPVEPPSCKRL